MPAIAFFDVPPEGAAPICRLHVTADGPGSLRRAVAEGVARAGGDAVSGFRVGPSPCFASATVLRAVAAGRRRLPRIPEAE